ncbi:ABC transporter substrate-binding protein [Aureimonas mangrovi]|uniref:ABC transporter substrate-binding protein n=1 Tax=Aureimonas mangrovi TaxID=2758041 RepID=UPI00163DB716|nr:ABC transporter substrate-binding protein [Aureimonas mangrovi]
MPKSLASFSAALLVFGAGAAGAQDLEPVAFQTDWIPSGEHAAYYGAWEKGIFAEHGLDVTITRGYGSGDTVIKLASGSFDFGVADVGAVLTGRARQDVPVKVVSTLYSHSPHSLFVLESSGITGFSDLDGKRIGITPGNSHRVYFPHIAEQSGTDASSINWVNMDGGAMATQLIAGNIDAAPFYSIHHYYQNKAAESAGESIVVLPFVEAGFEIYAASLITSDRTIEERPELVSRFVAAVHEAFEWARDNPEEACELHVQRVPEVAMDDCMGSLSATLEFVFNDHSREAGLGTVDAERLATTWQAVAEAEGLDLDWDPTQAFDTSFLPSE